MSWRSKSCYLEWLLVTHKVEQQDVSLAYHCAERLLFLVLLSVFDFKFRPVELLDIVAQVCRLRSSISYVEDRLRVGITDGDRLVFGHSDWT